MSHKGMTLDSSGKRCWPADLRRLADLTAGEASRAGLTLNDFPWRRGEGRRRGGTAPVPTPEFLERLPHLILSGTAMLRPNADRHT